MPIFMMQRRMRSGCALEQTGQIFLQLIYMEEGGTDE